MKYRKASETPQPSRGESQWEQLLSNRKTIFILLFGVTGFLGLPVLWMSHAFTTGEKVIWTIVNTIYTLALIGLAAGVCYWCYLQFQKSGLI